MTPSSRLSDLLPALGGRTLVMGILNVTPDSFSDGGLFAGEAEAVTQAERLVAEGAAILDVGGESTRPGHVPVPAEEEQARVVPVIRAVAPRLPVPISIDTYKASTARVALEAGARIVNDVWGLQREPDIATVAAAHGAPVIIMHNRETIEPDLDIVADMLAFFERSLAIAHRAGLADSEIVLDPGVGFGKTWNQHLEALRRLPEIRALGFPVLVGVSRKSLLGRLHDRETRPTDRLHGSLAAHAVAATLGADIVRVHDVAAHIDAMRVVDAVMRPEAR
ncbi:dihydropteroate synthase [Methylobacterium sp. PvP062]|uniref:Dihydropteroate synthase n=1 Tax=Methylobacterium radiotolerans (strain ATCC 27329 / DSM 1819 / JCM 2831 / NBRC 15690 / NCIMB 10815 / 0-1) TaxID=426355 RepID=B1LUE4_METRJ|nr:MULTISPECIES: dihydropteroate synthase [Methylobacterium]MCX7330590.1 dihydropteroate synthase [Hyphomicrobiales bacterium]ACB22524.1 dihydropteroate synthase [Methylobacterium radiotolerans JCM 2831]MBP2492981.1 dihydropteroate synthase [Methylobacterium sp. PvP105]MBP2500646.1 dihydropteroate synthase [Methylobacterium sp. PvP109]GEM96193.1 dihydropteroate synthase [Methylobacterium radiotolerans]